MFFLILNEYNHSENTQSSLYLFLMIDALWDTEQVYFLMIKNEFG